MDNLKKKYKPELYEKIKDNGYNYAKIIIPELRELFPIEQVLDVGCGGGSFLHGCVDTGMDLIYGVDGEHVESSLQIPLNCFEVANLEEPLYLGIGVDLCVSMEVAEHLDLKYSSAFVESLCRHSDNVLFSAAQVGQPGINHVNCQSLEFWIEKFKDNGFTHIEEVSNSIRNNSQIYNWYRKNSMLFRKV